jgi:3-phosphoshikimate 1-carboxyvinyltransferase
MKVGSSFDWFATHDGAPYQSFSRSTRTIGSNNFYEKEGLSAYSNQRTKITASKVNIPANVSSQYISVVSSAKIRKRNRNKFGWRNYLVPYIKMTLALLNDLDVKTSFEEM